MNNYHNQQQQQHYQSNIKARIDLKHDSTSSSLYSEIPNSFPYVRTSSVIDKPYINTNNNNINNNNNMPTLQRSECSFAHSDFIFECEGTLKKLYNNQRASNKRSLFPSHQSYELLYSRPVINNPFMMHPPINNYYQPVFYNTPVAIPQLHYQQPSHSCNYFNGYCNCMHMNNRFNPCLYPTQFFNDIQPLPLVPHQQQQRLLYMQTDGTLGLQAIPIEKPIVPYVKQQVPCAQQQQQQQQKYVMQQLPVPVARTYKRNSSYNESLRNRNILTPTPTVQQPQPPPIPKVTKKPQATQTSRIPTSVSSNDQFTESNKIHLAPSMTTANIESYRGSKNKMRNSKTVDSFDSRLTASKQPQNTKKLKTKLNDVHEDVDGRRSSTTDNDLNENLLLVNDESLSSLDDFVRSPYHRVTHNLDAHLYNTDYSSDRVSVDTIMKPINNFLNQQYNLSTYTNSRHTPVFIVKPKNITAKIGDTIKFRCSYYGLPTPKIQWYLNKVNLNTQLSNKYKIYFKNGYCLLKIFNLKLHDSGKITCCIENTYGKADASANLTVLYRNDEEIINSFKPKLETAASPSLNTTNNNKTIDSSDVPIIFNENIIYKFDHYHTQTASNQENPTPPVKKSLSKEEVRKLIIENLIMREHHHEQHYEHHEQHHQEETSTQHTLTYRVNRPNDNKNSSNDISEYFYHRIPVKRAQFDDSDDVTDVNEVCVNVNDRVTITTSNENATKSYWLHPNGLKIDANSDRYKFSADEKFLKLDIPSIQMDDCGKYKCIKIINNKETSICCNILVKES